MKRLLAIAIAFGFFSMIGFSGCGEETKVEDKKTTTTPEGSKVETKSDKIETKP